MNNYGCFRLDVFTYCWRWRNLPLRFQQILKHAEGLHSLPIRCSWICLVLLEFVKCSRSGLRLFYHTELMTMKICADICSNFIFRFFLFFYFLYWTNYTKFLHTPKTVEAITFRVICFFLIKCDYKEYHFYLYFKCVL